jgi:hypothetical protein
MKGRQGGDLVGVVITSFQGSQEERETYFLGSIRNLLQYDVEKARIS